MYSVGRQLHSKNLCTGTLAVGGEKEAKLVKAWKYSSLCFVPTCEAIHTIVLDFFENYLGEIRFGLKQSSQHVPLDVDGTFIYVLMSQEQSESQEHTVGDDLTQNTVHLYLLQSPRPRLRQQLQIRLGHRGLSSVRSYIKNNQSLF